MILEDLLPKHQNLFAHLHDTISEQRISEYKNEAHEVDLKNGSYGG